MRRNPQRKIILQVPQAPSIIANSSGRLYGGCDMSAYEMPIVGDHQLEKSKANLNVALSGETHLDGANYEC